jgi:hypothetical protein
VTRLDDYDVYTAAGGWGTAVTERFEAVAITDGALSVEFLDRFGLPAGNWPYHARPEVSGLAVTLYVPPPGPTPTPTPTATATPPRTPTPTPGPLLRKLFPALASAATPMPAATPTPAPDTRTGGDPATPIFGGGSSPIAGATGATGAGAGHARMSLRLSTLDGSRGDELRVSLILEADAPVGGFGTAVGFPTAPLELIAGGVPSELSGLTSRHVLDPRAGVVRIAVGGARPMDLPAGIAVFDMTFRVRHDAPPGPATLRLTDPLARDAAQSLMTVELSPVPTLLIGVVEAVDANADGSVDSADLMLLAAAYGLVEGEDSYDARVDLNDDGGIDIVDLALWGARYEA